MKNDNSKDWTCNLFYSTTSHLTGCMINIITTWPLCPWLFITISDIYTSPGLCELLHWFKAGLNGLTEISHNNGVYLEWDQIFLIILLNLYVICLTYTHFGLRGGDYVISQLHSHKTCYGHHLNLFFNVNSIMTLII